jgi:hypothetical protein
MPRIKALAISIIIAAAIASSAPQTAHAGGWGWRGGWGGWHGGWGGGWGGWGGGWGHRWYRGWGWGAVGLGLTAGLLAAPYYGYGYPGYYGGYGYPGYWDDSYCYLRRVWGPHGPYLVRVC